MGQAKRRGTFEERKAQAIARRAALTEQYRKDMQDPTIELPEQARKKRRARYFTGPMLVSAIAALTDSRGWRP